MLGCQMLDRAKYVISLHEGVCPKCQGTDLKVEEADGPISVWYFFLCNTCGYRLTERLRKSAERIKEEQERGCS